MVSWMQTLNNGIMSKLSAQIASITIITFVVGIFFITTLLTRDELSRTAQSMLSGGVVFAELTTPSLYQSYLTTAAEGSLSFTDALTERMRNNPDIIRVMMVSTGGKILFDSADLGTGTPLGRTAERPDRYLTDTETLSLLERDRTATRTYTDGGGQFTDIVVPILESTGSHALSMRFVLSYNELEKRRASIATRVLALSLPLTAVAVALSFFLAFSITRPLKRMAAVAQSIGQGDFSGIAPEHTAGELGALARSINEMSKDLKVSRDKDASYREELSLKVEQLEAAKMRLEKSLDELSRFTRVTVDRELRIKELKDRNKELEERTAGSEMPTPPIHGTDSDRTNT